LHDTSVPEIGVAQPLVRDAINRAAGANSLFDFDILGSFDVCGELVSPLVFVMSRKSEPSDGEYGSGA